MGLRSVLIVGTVVAAGSLIAQAARGVGATATERRQPLPGDEVLLDATVQRTHAVSIAAPPEVVWPWLAQLGQERGGFYTHAALENLAGCQVVNADTIVDEWQHPQPGGHLHLHPDMAMDIVRVDPGRALVARTAPEGPPGIASAYAFSWAFVVTEYPGGSRLLVRERYACQDLPAATIVRAVARSRRS